MLSTDEVLNFNFASTLHVLCYSTQMCNLISRAVADFDAVCGDNIPNFEHKLLLPYIEAICREVLRW